MVVLVWCILTEKPLNLPRLIRQAMGRVQIAGNLPFPAFVIDLVSTVGVSYWAGDTRTMIPRDDEFMPNGKYIRPSMPYVSRNEDPSFDAPSSSTPPSSTPHAPPPPTNQLLLEIPDKLDWQGRQIEQIEHRNKCQYNYLKELVSCTYTPPEEPDTPKSTLNNSMESHEEQDSGSDDSNPTLLITDGTENRAKH
ncbi:hypothetical protein AHAS_Ahas12G0124300 [Arachis hypogaea]